MSFDQPLDSGGVSGPPDMSSVRVAVRIRPQSARERIEFCRVCTTVTPGEPQILLGNDRGFTFDYVFNSDSPQDQVFETCARPLILGCLDGYNSTIFAYGQTGSGKTYTMGTSFEVDPSPNDLGIIPRSVAYLFALIRERREQASAQGLPAPDFNVSAQFLELYNEEVYDLFASSDREVFSKQRGRSAIKIHESSKGEIVIENATSRTVQSLNDTMECLRLGSLARATASTAMNAQSSRSHAIFTLYIKQQRAVLPSQSIVSSSTDTGLASSGGPDSSPGSDAMVVSTGSSTTNGQDVPEFEVLTAKFHFVDLAGSERLKRTGATGERAREGISINCGLLALGNVISALGDTARHATHVPYRDSKLTRILQDSLGGNSCTIMIACISPSDCDFVETLNTLKYANRARNIKNKVTVNQDKTSAVISALRAEIIQLKQELLEFRQGKRLVDSEGTDHQNDVDKENAMLLRDNDLLRRRIHALQATVENQSETVARLSAAVESDKLAKIMGENGIENGHDNHENGGDESPTSECSSSTESIILRYARENERLRAQLIEAEALCKQFMQTRNGATTQRSAHNTPRPLSATMNSTNSNFLNPLLNGNNVLSNSFSSPAMQAPFATSSTNATPSSASKFLNGLERESTTLTSILESFGPGNSGNMNSEDDDALLDEARVKLALLLQRHNEMQSSNGSDNLAGNGHPDTESTLQDEDGGATLQNVVEMTQIDSEITEIQKQINIQQQLIDRLEMSQRQMAMMRQQYEQKVGVLQAKIRETEAERDRVLNSVERTESATKDKSENLRADYEAKINSLQQELRKVQQASREYARNQAKLAETDRQLEKMRSELQSMKQAKTQLVRKLRDEGMKQRKTEAEKNREIAQLKRQQQQKDSVIQKLEAEKRMREVVLKRQQEEQEALRKRQLAAKRLNNNRTILGQTNGQNSTMITGSNATVTVGPVLDALFTTEECEEVWNIFIRRLNHLVAGRSLINRTDCELKRLLGERETLNQRLQRYLRQRGHMNASPLARNAGEIMADLEAQIDALKANIRYNEDSIEECQRRIIQLISPQEWQDSVPSSIDDEAGGSSSRDIFVFDQEVDLKRILTGAACRTTAMVKSPDALRFLVEKLMNAFITQGINLETAQQSKTSVQIAGLQENLVSSSSNQNGFYGELVPTGDQDFAPPPAQVIKTPTRPTANQPPSEDLSQQTPKASDAFMAVSNRSAKARRWSATTQELLFGRTPGGTNVTMAPVAEQDSEISITSEPDSNRPLADSDALVEALTESDLARAHLLRSNTTSVGCSNGDTAGNGFPPPIQAPSSPSQQRLIASTSQLNGNGTDNGDPNVFQRLTRGSRRGTTAELTAGLGDLEAPASIRPSVPGKIRASTSFVLNNSASFSTSLNASGNAGRTSSSSSPQPCFSAFDPGAPVVEYVAQASGHSRTVLCVTGDSRGILFSGSKDRTAKAWDLHCNRELFTLTGHPDSVVKILYSEQYRLLFTVAGACIRVWDMRCFEHPVAEMGSPLEQPLPNISCCHTLLSSGLGMEGAGSKSELMRMGRSDSIIDAGLLTMPNTEYLMSSLNGDVRVWDIRNFISMAKLIAPGSGMSAVMSLATSIVPYRYVFTGSRDHLVRFYDLSSGLITGSIAPRLTFEPPHCDTVNSLAFNASCSQAGGRMVTFSGSRDGSLKKWEWDSISARSPGDITCTLQSNAHRSGISSLAVIPWLVDSDYQDQLLVSGGRDGAIRIWNASPDVPLTPLAEVSQAHPHPINAVAGASTDNGIFVYTASNDRHVRIWRLATKD